MFVNELYTRVPLSHSAVVSNPSLTQKTNDKCFAKCVTKPSTSLSSSEEVRSPDSFRHVPLIFFFFFGFFLCLTSHVQTCLSRCFDRYMEACKRTHVPAKSFSPERTNNADLLVNIISRTYASRLTKERLDGLV